MSTIERIAYHRGRRDEVPNQELARVLVRTRDAAGIAEIAEHLGDKNKSIAGDCIKVLYEIGYIDPALIEPHTVTFIDHLHSRQNRVVWGSMIAIWTLADTQHGRVWSRIDEVVEAIERGSVITIDAGVKALSIVASKDPTYERRLRPLLFDILRTCDAKRIPSHSEAMAVMVNDVNVDEFLSVATERNDELSAAQARRLDKVIDALTREG